MRQMWRMTSRSERVVVLDAERTRVCWWILINSAGVVIRL